MIASGAPGPTVGRRWDSVLTKAFVGGFLTAEEIGRLNAVLTRDEFYCPQAVAIIRLLMLTGCRFGEIVFLEWDWIKGKRIHLPNSKSGALTV